ncbi:hypothetical protein JJJ17_06800 [Paracoccus caeni]|uniref:Uncharacterized protein n=1 Tax=Paracoccus caeni TaxID=657651 RepID=A0A934VZT2_9RHOB|nr:hypothetical protein [Paracoccus caeni]MBK4215628.1 hypothetical protein [Paracoccus caeni]
MSALAVYILSFGIIYLILCAQLYGVFRYFHPRWRESADKKIIDLVTPFLIALCLMAGTTVWIVFAGLSGLAWVYTGTRVRRLATDRQRFPATVTLGVAPYYFGSVSRTLFFDIFTFGVALISALIVLV